MSSASLFLFNFLLNALWQIPLVFGAAYLAAHLTRHNGPQWEHRIWVAALFFELLLPFGQLNFKPVAAFLLSLFTPAVPSATSGSISVVTGAATTAASGWQLPPVVIASALIAWVAAIVYFAARLVWKLDKTSELRRRAHSIAPEDYPVLHHFFSTHPAPPQLLVSNSVSSPAIVGTLSPALLLPPSFFDRTSASDVEATLAHELAHLRRRDYAKNLLYEILTLPIAWHPLVSLTRSRIAESREILCDHIAAQTALGRHHYARALLRLASQQDGHTPQSIHAIGIFDTRSLERRIMKLTQSQIQKSHARRLLTLAACAALAVATASSALALRVNAAAATGHGKQSSSKPVQVSAEAIAGNRISGKIPKYPAEAKKKHIQGTVVVKALISKQGRVVSTRVISGPKILRAPSVKAIRTWRYRPYMIYNRPVAVSTTINVVYSLDGHKPDHKSSSKPNHTMAMLHSPQLRQQMERAQQAALSSAKVQRQLAQAQKSVAAAEARINSPAFRQQIQKVERAARQIDTAKIQKQIEEARQKAFHSAKVQQQIAQAQKQMAAAEARINSRKFKQQIAEAEKQAIQAQLQLKNSKIQKQMAAARQKLQQARQTLKTQSTGNSQPSSSQP